MKKNKFLNYLLHKYVYEIWNIAIADLGDDLVPYNVKWLKHPYNDRWFADPFIIDEDDDNFIALVEEYLYASELGRISKLIIRKCDCQLVDNQMLLELPTHLSFPNWINYNEEIYLIPENAASGKTFYYKYDNNGIKCMGALIDQGLADPVFFQRDGNYYILATEDKECNGNILKIYESKNPFTGYQEVQEIIFNENIARRAGKIFKYKDSLISPAQICNSKYGEGISLQKMIFNENAINLKEYKRIYPISKTYQEAFHTYNVFKDKIIIDGYKFGSPTLSNLYFKIRK